MKLNLQNEWFQRLRFHTPAWKHLSVPFCQKVKPMVTSRLTARRDCPLLFVDQRPHCSCWAFGRSVRGYLKGGQCLCVSSKTSCRVTTYGVLLKSLRSLPITQLWPALLHNYNFISHAVHKMLSQIEATCSTAPETPPPAPTPESHCTTNSLTRTATKHL